MLIAKKWG